jgi:hypothetical protein
MGAQTPTHDPLTYTWCKQLNIGEEVGAVGAHAAHDKQGRAAIALPCEETQEAKNSIAIEGRERGKMN